MAKNNLNAKLQELSRKLQQQNKEIKEEDVLQRKQMIENFQNTLSDLKSRYSSAQIACDTAGSFVNYRPDEIKCVEKVLPVCRVDENNVRREEAFNEKKGLLDMQIVMEEHYKAKVKSACKFKVHASDF